MQRDGLEHWPHLMEHCLMGSAHRTLDLTWGQRHAGYMGYIGLKPSSNENGRVWNRRNPQTARQYQKPQQWNSRALSNPVPWIAKRGESFCLVMGQCQAPCLLISPLQSPFGFGTLTLITCPPPQQQQQQPKNLKGILVKPWLASHISKVKKRWINTERGLWW